MSHESLEYNISSVFITENTVANAINAAYVQHMMGRLGVILSNVQWFSCNRCSDWLYFLCYGVNEGFEMLSMLSIYKTVDNSHCSVIGYKVATGNVALKWVCQETSNFVQ